LPDLAFARFFDQWNGSEHHELCPSWVVNTIHQGRHSLLFL
jgi:hypothetical protein